MPLSSIQRVTVELVDVNVLVGPIRFECWDVANELCALPRTVVPLTAVELIHNPKR